MGVRQTEQICFVWLSPFFLAVKRMDSWTGKQTEKKKEKQRRVVFAYCLLLIPPFALRIILSLFRYLLLTLLSSSFHFCDSMFFFFLCPYLACSGINISVCVIAVATRLARKGLTCNTGITTVTTQYCEQKRSRLGRWVDSSMHLLFLVFLFQFLHSSVDLLLLAVAPVCLSLLLRVIMIVLFLPSLFSASLAASTNESTAAQQNLLTLQKYEIRSPLLPSPLLSSPLWLVRGVNNVYTRARDIFLLFSLLLSFLRFLFAAVCFAFLLFFALLCPFLSIWLHIFFHLPLSELPHLPLHCLSLHCFSLSLFFYSCFISSLLCLSLLCLFERSPISFLSLCTVFLSRFPLSFSFVFLSVNSIRCRVSIVMICSLLTPCCKHEQESYELQLTNCENWNHKSNK